MSPEAPGSDANVPHNVEFVYYLVYHEERRIATRRPAYLDDIYIGRIRSKWVTPPHTAGSLKRCLCFMENIDPELTKLFASVSNQSALEDEVPISFKSNQTLGVVPEDPVILFSKAMPRVEIQPGTERLRVAPDSKSPVHVAPRFLFYGVYAETGAQASKDPIDAEEPWVSKIDLNSILYPVSVASLLQNISKKEGINPCSQLLAQDGGPLGDDQIFTKDGNWLGASAEDHLVLKLASLPPFAEGSRYKVQNWRTGYSLVSWVDQTDVSVALPGFQDGPWKHFTLGLQDDGSVAFQTMHSSKTWIGPNCSHSTTKHGFWLISSTTNKDYFFICEGDAVSRKAFYDAKAGRPNYDLVSYMGFTSLIVSLSCQQLRELDTTDSRQMWTLIPV